MHISMCIYIYIYARGCTANCQIWVAYTKPFQTYNRRSTETNRCLAKRDLGSHSVLRVVAVCFATHGPLIYVQASVPSFSVYSLSLYIYIYLFMYSYLYIERKRKRERERYYNNCDYDDYYHYDCYVYYYCYY